MNRSQDQWQRTIARVMGGQPDLTSDLSRIAAACKVTVETVTSWVSGDAFPDPTQTAALEAVLGVPPGQLGRHLGYVRIAGGGLESALLDMAEAAVYLATSERHMRRLVLERRITFVKIGRKVRFRREDLDALIKANLMIRADPQRGTR